MEILAAEGLKIEDEEKPLVEDEVKEAYQEIKRKKHAFREEHALKRNKTAYQKNKSMEKIKDTLEDQGLDATLVEERLRNRSRSKSLFDIKRKKAGDMMDEDEENEEKMRSRIREASRSRSKGHKREMSVEEIKGSKVINKLSKVWRTRDKKGETDRFVGNKMPKHLFSGKMSNGKRDRR